VKNIFTPEFIGKSLIQIVGIGIIVFLIQGYFNNKWQPVTASNVLRKQNSITSKKDVYFEAINIATRELSGYDFHGPKIPDNYIRNIGTTLPTEFEINSCLTRLYIFSDNPQVINSFKRLFSKGNNPIEENIKLIKYIRLDLVGDNKLDANKYEYIQMSRDTTAH